MSQIFLNKNVWDAALERIRFLFDEFPNVVVGISGGKDSTVVYHLALQVAREKKRLPLPVFFLDQEAEWTGTIDIVRQIMYEPDVRPLWFQMPMLIENASSYDVKYLKCWDPEAEADWIRPKDPISVKENTFGTEWFLFLFKPIMKQLFPKQPAAFISGIRCEESRARFVGLTGGAIYKWVTWGKKLAKNQFTFYPIYDWCFSDVWHAIAVNHWPYNPVYDLQYQFGIPVKEMRISNLHHETSIRCVMQLQEFDRELYDRVCKRLPGIATANTLQDEFFAGRDLPFMFQSWCDYRDFLIEKLTTGDARWYGILKKKSAEWDELFKAVPKHKEKSARQIVQAIITNDYNGTKISNWETAFVNLYKQELLFSIPWKENKFRLEDNPDLFAVFRRRAGKKGRFKLHGQSYRLEGDVAYREAS